MHRSSLHLNSRGRKTGVSSRGHECAFNIQAIRSAFNRNHLVKVERRTKIRKGMPRNHELRRKLRRGPLSNHRQKPNQEKTDTNQEPSSHRRSIRTTSEPSIPPFGTRPKLPHLTNQPLK